VHNDMVHVTTPEAAENKLEVRIYVCRDFLEIPSLFYDRSGYGGGMGGGGMGMGGGGMGGFQNVPPERIRGQMGMGGGGDSKHRVKTLVSLINLIKSTIEPLSWDDQGGSGTAQPLSGGILTIAATSRVHAKVEQLLQKLRTAKKVGPNAMEMQVSQITATEQKLQQRIDVAFVDTPLKEVVASLSTQLDVPFIVDERALTEIGMDSNTPVNIDLRNIKAEVAMDLMLNSLGLTWLVHNDMVHVTTPEAAENKLEVRIYVCRDFLDITYRSGGGGDSRHRVKTLNDLINLIKSTIEPLSWDDQGGSRTVQPLSGGILTIAATSPVHAKVEQLLQKLRTAKKSLPGKATRYRELPLPQVDEVIKIPAGGPATPRVAPAGPNPVAPKDPAAAGKRNPFVPKDPAATPVRNPFTPKGPAANPFGGGKPPAANKNPFK